MATKALTGRGTTLSIGNGASPEVFTAIMQVKTYQFSGQQASYDDITNTGSAVSGTSNVAIEELLPSKVSLGTLALTGVFLPSDAGQTALSTAFTNQTLTDFKLQLPLAPGQTTTGNLYTLSAYIQDFPLPDLQWDKAATFKATLKLMSLTVTPGS
jgi:hypothetical protein